MKKIIEVAEILNIGSGKDNNIIIPEKHVSLQHAQIIFDDEDKVYINDLGSSNGTLVNGTRITGTVELIKGDTVLISGNLIDWEKYKTIKNGNLISPAKKPSLLKLYFSSLFFVIILISVILIINEIVCHYRIDGFGSHFVGNINSDNTSKSYDGIGNTKDSVPSKRNKKINYDFSCFVTEENKNTAITFEGIDQIRDAGINASGITVSIEEEMKFGSDNHKKLIQGMQIVYGADAQRLDKILSKLVSNIDKPKGFKYIVYLVDSKEINAWTCGGRIYFTTAIYNFSKSDDEIAGILSHEIYHNELGHINKMLRVQKLSNETFGGELGGIAATIDQILRSPFGKKDEAFSDFKGADLSIVSGFNACEIVNLWDRMASNSKSNSTFDEFLSSHPFPSKRRDCLRNHISVNYNVNCN